MDSKQPSAADVAREIRAQEAAEKKAKEAEQSKKAGQGCAIFIAIVVVIGLIVWMNTNNNSSSTSTTTSETITLPGGREVSAALAKNLCQDVIKDQLISPSTARFPSVSSSDYRLPSRVGNTWRGTIAVDSQNALGAMIRSTWSCEVSGDTGLTTVRQQQ